MERQEVALAHAAERLAEMHQSGALDLVMDLAEVLNAARASMSDGMIARMGTAARVLAEAGDTVMTSGLAGAAPDLVRAVAEARDEALASREPLGLLAALRALREPEVQFALKFALALVRKLPIPK